MAKKYSFEEVCKMPEYDELCFEEKQIMYVVRNADKPLTEEEIMAGIAELEKQLKVN